MHKYVLIADIENMYRQIRVAEGDYHYQRIPVSYTHLDVYKRQVKKWLSFYLL